MFFRVCTAVLANLVLVMLYSLFCSFSLLASSSYVWMNYSRKDMAWALEFHFSSQPISGKLFFVSWFR